MPTFPLDISHILALAEKMIAGLEENKSVFPSPPVPPQELREARDEAVEADDAQVAAQAAAKAATEVKTDKYARLSDKMKDDISYAKHAVTSPAELSLIGWGPRAEPSPLAPPGQPGSLAIPEQDAGKVQLTWNKPQSGGKPAFYRVEMRTVDPAGDWILKGAGISTTAELTGLECGVALEFRIIAENSAGTGSPSNTVTAVL
ncbi:fibronectin type III domain-containing protein [Candidatus Electrothrix sp.]|uniref:fibronectin type III domain-containing protein n=1 Tax=Candidatus Electrothrix sp. TaxID=2170559 RepID=UPI00405799B5